MNGGCGWIIHFRFYFVFWVGLTPYASTSRGIDSRSEALKGGFYENRQLIFHPKYKKRNHANFTHARTHTPHCVSWEHSKQGECTRTAQRWQMTRSFR